MTMRRTVNGLQDVVRNATFPGARGGGNWYVSRLMIERAMRETGRELACVTSRKCLLPPWSA